MLTPFVLASGLNVRLAEGVADTLTVMDDDGPALRVESITVPVAAQTDEYVSIAYRIGNQGLAPTQTHFLTRVSFSHDSCVGDDTLAGRTHDVTAFLSLQTVQYVWSVVPVETEDRYRILVETVFEATVPLPVVTLEPKVIDLAAVTHETLQVDLRISNHGLIAAHNMRLKLPTHPGWTFTSVIKNIGTLPAQSSLVIPIRIERTTPVSPAPERARKPKDSGDGPCSHSLKVNWQLECMGLTLNYNDTVRLLNLRTDCLDLILQSHRDPLGSAPGSDPDFPVETPVEPPGWVSWPKELREAVSLCNCSMYPQVCINGSFGINAGSWAAALKTKLASMLGGAGVYIPDPAVGVSAGGTLCTCCDGNNHISYQGDAQGTAQIQAMVCRA